jgi:hypothetical protein
MLHDPPYHLRAGVRATYDRSVLALTARLPDSADVPVDGEEDRDVCGSGSADAEWHLDWPNDGRRLEDALWLAEEQIGTLRCIPFCSPYGR